MFTWLENVSNTVTCNVELAADLANKLGYPFGLKDYYGYVQTHRQKYDKNWLVRSLLLSKIIISASLSFFGPLCLFVCLCLVVDKIKIWSKWIYTHTKTIFWYGLRDYQICYYVKELYNVKNKWNCFAGNVLKRNLNNTKATVNAKIPSAALISIRATCWECETVGTMNQSRYISMHRGCPWNSQACEAV